MNATPTASLTASRRAPVVLLWPRGAHPLHRQQANPWPIVLFAGFALLEKCFRFLPSRHYVAVVFGLFPSTCGEET